MEYSVRGFLTWVLRGVRVNSDAYEKAKDFIRKYPSLIKDTPLSIPHYETLRNIAENYGTRENIQEPSAKTIKEYEGVMAILETSLSLEQENKTTFNHIFEALKIGPRKVMLQVLSEIPTVTRREIGTQYEEIYCYSEGFYSRGEERLRQRSKDVYIDTWNQGIETADKLLRENGSDETMAKRIIRVRNEFKEKLDTGPNGGMIDEVLKQIRLETFRDPSEFNPKSHIPFRNGLLRLSDWQLIHHTPDLIYLWRIEANLLYDKIRSINLNDCPKYRGFLQMSFESWDIPMLLQYGGYSFYPIFPRQVTLWIVGRPRIGKGTQARILKEINPIGYGAISFEKLLINGNRFAFRGIEGKNLLVDPEVKRVFRKGSRPDFGNFNKLFGSDSLDLEKKGKQSYDYVSVAKGLFIANLPHPKTDDEPFLLRVLLVKAKDRIIKKSELIPNLDSVILESERDQIAMLYVGYLKVLSERNWIFISEMSAESTMELWELFSDVVQFYLDEMVESSEEGQIECEAMYRTFKDWCKAKGIPVMNSQSFKKEVGGTYKKKRVGVKKKRYYVFVGCRFSEQDDPEVRHQEGSHETLDIRGSYYRNKPCPTSVHTIDVEGKKYEKFNRVNVPKLDNYEIGPGEAKIKSSPRNETVSNLEDDSKSVQVDDSPDGRTDIEKRSISDASKGYASIEIVCKALKDRGITVDEYDRKLYSKNEYKAKLNGKMSDFSDEVQNFINSSFKVVFPGSIDAPHTWINFAIKPIGDDLSHHD